MTKTKKNLIDYIYANKGGIVFTSGGFHNQVGFAKSPKVVAYVLKTKGIADTLLHSSSMDFASEYGFANDDDAWILWQDGVELDDKKAREIA